MNPGNTIVGGNDCDQFTGQSNGCDLSFEYCVSRIGRLPRYVDYHIPLL